MKSKEYRQRLSRLQSKAYKLSVDLSDLIRELDKEEVKQ